LWAVRGVVNEPKPCFSDNPKNFRKFAAQRSTPRSGNSITITATSAARLNANRAATAQDDARPAGWVSISPAMRQEEARGWHQRVDEVDVFSD